MVRKFNDSAHVSSRKLVVMLAVLAMCIFVLVPQAICEDVTDILSRQVFTPQVRVITGNDTIINPADMAHFSSIHVPAGFLPELGAKRASVGVALSGGGARGLAEIGVLQELVSMGVPIDVITGTSMGGVIAGMYSAGYSPEELERLFRSMDWNSLFRDSPRRRNLFLAQKEVANQELVTVRFQGFKPYIPNALLTGETLYLKLLQLTLSSPYGAAVQTFDQMKVPVGLVATDLNSGDRVFFRDGDLAIAMRASLAIPVIFQPIELNGRLLVDGGSMENIPVRAALECGVDHVIAVDCASPEVPELDPDDPWAVANQVTTLMSVANDSVSRSMAEVVITPDLEGFSQADFDRVKELIASGKRAVQVQSDELRRLVPDGTQPELEIYISSILIGALSREQREGLITLSGLETGWQSTRSLNEALERILRHIRSMGYAAAHIHATISQDGALQIAVDPGEVVDIIIEGVPQKRQGVVMRNVGVRIGQPLRQQELVNTLTRLHATGRYTVVYAYIEPHPDGGVILRLLLDNAPFPKLGLSLGFDTDRQARYYANYVDVPGILKQGEELTLKAIYGTRDESYTLSFRVDRVARTYLGWELSAGYLFREQDFFALNGDVLRTADIKTSMSEFSALFNLKTWGKVSGGIRLEHIEHDIPGVEESENLACFQIEGVLDTEDRQPFPRSGIAVKIQYDSYLGYLNSERAFNRLQFKAEAVVPILPRYIGRVAWHTGVADLTTPATHEFRIGGLQDFPAFRTDRFMGLRFIHGTGELRFDLISRIIADAYILARYDVMAFSDDESWRPKKEELVHSYSAGFALDTILGPMEIWYGFSPPSRSAESHQRVAVNLGYRF